MTQSHGSDDWHDPERAQRFAARIESRDEERAPMFALMAAMLPFSSDAPLRMLDLGTGLGSAASALLRAFPRAQAIGLDISEAMIGQGRGYTRDVGERLRFQQGDFSHGIPGDVAGPFDAIVSALAIHHLPVEAKQRLYVTCYERLNSGGAFINLDYVQPPDAYLIERYQAAHERADAAAEHATEDGHAAPTRHYHGGRLEQHLDWLREARFASVDCFAKQLNLALFGGFRR